MAYCSQLHCLMIASHPERVLRWAEHDRDSCWCEGTSRPTIR